MVRQRLKLAAVSPCLIDLYRNEEMSLDQLMAFTVTDDHEAQESAWFGQPDWQRNPAAIRRTLTSAHVEADDERVRFVGLAVYQAAGGEIVRDLFQPDHEGYLTDPALLDRLVAERLKAEAATVLAEGWKWVEIVPDLDRTTLRDFGRVQPESLPLSPERQEEIDRLGAEQDALIDEHGDDPEPEIADQLDALSARIEAIGEEALSWRAEDKAVTGAIVGIGYDGNAVIERGLIRPDDRKSHSVIEGGKAGEGDSADAVEPASPLSATSLSARLVEDLTAERTAALRAMMPTINRWPSPRCPRAGLASVLSEHGRRRVLPRLCGSSAASLR